MKDTTKKIMGKFDREFKERNKIEFVPEHKEPFLSHKNRAVDILFGGGNHLLGFYRGLTLNWEDLVIFPVLAAQYYPDSLRKEEEGTKVYLWEDRPAFVSFRICNAMIPASEDYLVERANQAKKEFGSQVYLP